MRKLRVSIFLTILTLLMLVPMIGPTPKVKAGFYVEYDTVRYSCIIGPGDHRGEIVGEWTIDCFGNMSGWGWEPGESCTYTDVRFGDECIME
jgi:hypothetical protein